MDTIDAPLQLLIIARQPAGANSLLSALRREGQACFATAVDSSERLRDCLAERAWDLLLCLADDSPLAPGDLPALCREAGWEGPVLLLGAALEQVADYYRLGYSEVLTAAESHKLPFVMLRQAAYGRAQRKLLRQNAALAELQQRHALLLENSTDAVSYLREGMHTWCNASYAAFLGYPDRASIERVPLLDLIVGADRARVKQRLATQADPGLLQAGLRRQDGSEVSAALQFNPLRLDGVACLQLNLREADGDLAHREAIAELEGRDLLTLLLKPALFRRKLEQAINAVLDSAAPAALLLVRLDEFPDIESALGRRAANRILADLADLLQDSVGREFSAARLADHEFALLLPACEPAAALDMVEVIRAAIDQRVAASAMPALRLSCRVGLAMINANSLDADTLVLRARHNLGLRRADESGYHFGDGSLTDYLAQALDMGRFRLLFQPVVPLKGQIADTYEVFTHLLDSEGREVPPAVFMPVLRLLGLGERFDRLVLERALALIASEQTRAALTVKLTQDSLLNPALLSWLSRRLRKLPPAAAPLSVQISEIDLHQHPQAILAFCQGLAELGLGRVVSDFGCALDPFRHLSEIAPDYVMLDDSLLRELPYSEQQRRKLSGLVSELRRRNCLVGAPRVENLDLLPTLWQSGISLIQGRGLQRPSPEMNYPFVREEEITLSALPAL